MAEANLALDPAKTRAIIFTYPDRSITWEAACWLWSFIPPDNILSVSGKNLIKTRNAVMKEACLNAPAQYTDFLWLDRDMRPSQKTVPFLLSPADVVGAMYPLDNMDTWASPETLHMGLIRFKRRVIEAVKPPWFQFEYTQDGSELTSCECSYFLRKVKECGFSIARAGWCEHGGCNQGGH